MKKHTPTVSIIIVNYNGRKWLDACLTSVFAIDFDPDAFEVIVVDNNSNDNSVSFIKKKFPKVILIESNENGGFTGGNNLGYAHARGTYIVLLNTDTTVDRGWLRALVSTAESQPHAGIVQSKLLFATPFVPITVDSAVIPRSALNATTDHRPLGILIENIVINQPDLQPYVWYEKGFYPPTHGEIPMRWTNGHGEVFLPIPTNTTLEMTMTVHGLPNEYQQDTPFTVKIDEHVLMEGTIRANHTQQFTCVIDPKQFAACHFWVVQNAGNCILKNGLGKDRGSVIRKEADDILEFYEKDNAYFTLPTQISAMCGASCLIKREVIDQIGFFDGHYFMYYEDLEFSVRAWRMGWDCVFAPDSIAYHHHKASTKQGNWLYFHHLIERNHLLFLSTHFSVRLWAIQFFIFCLKFALTAAIYTGLHFRNNIAVLKEWEQRYHLRKAVFVFFIQHFSRILRNRQFWRTHSRRPFSKLYATFY